jgi:predicted O-methyltransferase YrrM
LKSWIGFTQENTPKLVADTDIINNLRIAPNVLARFAVHSLKNPKLLRYELVRNVWTLMKTYSAGFVENVGLDQIVGINDILVKVSVGSYDRAVLCAITKLVEPKSFFEFGTYLGETALAVARNNPQAKILTLDLPNAEARQKAKMDMTDEYLFERWDRGAAFKGVEESKRIEQLTGDSATFDFEPYQHGIDLVFIDASHSYSYVKSDTEAALRIVSPDGTILWHDYPAYPGVFVYLNELAARLDRKIYHINGTGLAFCSSKVVVAMKSALSG